MVGKKSKKIRDRVIETFKRCGGILRTSQAISLGIDPHIIYELRDAGLLEQLNRGIYALPGFADEHPDFILVSSRVPEGVICLTSALAYHGLTVQIPRWIDVAVKKGYKPPKIEYPPVKFHWYSDSTFNSGIEEIKFGDARVRIYSKAKSIVDSFRLRSKVGTNVAVEALKNYFIQGGADWKEIVRLAKESRVLQIIEPYIEAVTNDQS
jgi:predicted transcriptional regulator of viral defense system